MAAARSLLIATGMLVCASGLAMSAPPAKAPQPAPDSWDRAAAARYLDGREVWWQGWDHARRDHDTRCVSCHTQAPYALARPFLRPALGETGLSAPEQAMLADVEKRVRSWDTMLPFYSDEKYGSGKEVESRNAESVLNAVILAGYDQNLPDLTERTRMAFDHAFALQTRTGPDAGSWVWQNFNYAPWESSESQYHWAALMAMATARAPGHFREEPTVRPRLAALKDFLSSHFAQQPLVNKVAALWASAYLPGLLTHSEREGLVSDLTRLEHPDGGWSLTDLGTWHRRDNTALETRSDGYATALIVLALEETATAEKPGPKDSYGGLIVRGREWLVAHQDRTTGSWPAWSVNKDRDPRSDAGLFMTDAATGYAILALDHSTSK